MSKTYEWPRLTAMDFGMAVMNSDRIEMRELFTEKKHGLITWHEGWSLSREGATHKACLAAFDQELSSQLNPIVMEVDGDALFPRITRVDTVALT